MQFQNKSAVIQPRKKKKGSLKAKCAATMAFYQIPPLNVFSPGRSLLNLTKSALSHL